jgi:hypothetical protein
MDWLAQSLMAIGSIFHAILSHKVLSFVCSIRVISAMFLCLFVLDARASP